nr:gfo/Idh/MocA family oxidoreductase [Rhizobium sp. Q54]
MTSKSNVDLSVSRRTAMGLGFTGAIALAASAVRAQELQTPPNEPVGRPQPVLEKDPPLTEERKIGFAVVGLGKLALGEVLPAFGQSRAAKLVALVSGNPEKAAKIAQQAGLPDDAIYNYENFDDIANNDRIQVVYIILPNALHKDFTIRALNAGKHVLCEKPMATSVADCEAMIAAAEEANRKLMVAYRCQYEPHNLEAMKVLREGRVGAVKIVSTDNGRPSKLDDPADQWRLDRELSGGGALLDIGIYGINGTRYLLNEEPTEVRAWAFTDEQDPRFAETEDVISWQLRFPSGIIANGTTSFSYSETSRLEVIGDKGRVKLDPATNYRGLQLAVNGEDGEEQPKIEPIDQFAKEMDHMALAVLNGADVVSPGEEGMQDIRIMEAILQSVETGQAVEISSTYRRAIDPVEAEATGG